MVFVLFLKLRLYLSIYAILDVRIYIYFYFRLHYRLKIWFDDIVSDNLFFKPFNYNCPVSKLITKSFYFWVASSSSFYISNVICSKEFFYSVTVSNSEVNLEFSTFNYLILDYKTRFSSVRFLHLYDNFSESMPAFWVDSNNYVSSPIYCSYSLIFDYNVSFFLFSYYFLLLIYPTYLLIYEVSCS